jgi:FkbM family methyltransferase
MATFCNHWPEEVAIAVYVEEDCQHPEFVDLRKLPAECYDFIDRHENNEAARGIKPVPGWRKKDERAGYAWRYDAVRFCRQLFIPEDAVSRLHDGDIFAWLDGDVITYKDIPDDFIENLLRDDDMVFLGRHNGATELGFWALRVNPLTRSFVAELASLCKTDQIFKFQEWHSGYIWDRVREQYEEMGMKARNLTPMGQGHVWFQCDLGCYTDHLKGTERKQRGYSLERNQTVAPNRLQRSVPSNVPNQEDLLGYCLNANGPAGGSEDAIAVGIGASDLDVISLVSRCKRTFVFEPDKERADAFREKYKDNPRVLVRNYAVLDGGGNCRLMDGGGYTPDTEGSAASIALDQILNELKSCGIVRINAGGAEMQVLHGMRRILADHHPLLVIRMCGLGKRYGNKDWQLQALLEDHFNYSAILHAHPYYAYKYTGL